MKNKHRLLAVFLIVVFAASFLFFGKIFGFLTSISELTGADILYSSEEQNEEYEEYEEICKQNDFSKNYNDCIHWQQTHEKQNTLEKLSNDSADSFCAELIRIYEHCE